MTYDIVVTSPHKEVTQLVEQIGGELNLKITMIEAALEDAVSLTKGILSENAQRICVIISRGATLNLLRKEIHSVPLVNMDLTEYDIILAIDQAQSLGNKIGLLATDPEQMGVLKNISKIIKLPLKFYLYTNLQDFYVQFEKAQCEGIEVLVGGGEKGAFLTKERGIRHVPLLARKSTVRQALIRAKDIIDTTKREKENAEQIKAILTYSHEGIMAVDENNVVSVFNPMASRIYSLNEHDVIGRPLKDLNFRRSIIEMFEGPEERLGYIQKTRDALLMVNKVPIRYQDRFKGILVTFKDITTIIEEESKVRRALFAKGHVAKFSFNDIVHTSGKMLAIMEKAKKFANTDCIVLIRGESGTGKELIAQSMHNAHLVRRNRPFVAINCASLDDNLLKSELFGYEEGAFTGARKGGRQGLFEVAHGGTLFLDEIGKISLELQANLLRVLQEKKVRRIGGDRLIPIDVRITAASNEDLEALIKDGKFREDLYFRLKVLDILLPPLRERKEDIPSLVSSILNRLSNKYNKPIYSFPQAVLRRLSLLDWPGNIRQLEHLLERCIVLAETETEAPRVMMELIEEEFVSNSRPEDPLTHDHVSVQIGSLQEMENEIVQKIYAREKYSKTELALRLGVSRTKLWKILK